MQFKKIVLTGLGFIFLGFGAIGLLLPIWPTTPFVLLSVACFSSSPDIKNKIMKNPFFKEHIENYDKRTGLSNKTVITSLLWLWGALVVSMVLIKYLWICLLLMFIGALVTAHILYIAKAKNRRKSKK